LTASEGFRPRYQDRMQAGFELAGELQRLVAGQDPVILAIPKGGVHVAASVATQLEAPLDLAITRRIAAPGRREATLGAITPDRTLVINKTLVSQLNLPDEEVDSLSIPAWAEAQRAQQLYRGNRPPPDLRGRTAVIVDDRVITGYSMMAAAVSVRKLEPSRVVVAVPVAYVEGMDLVRGYVDDMLALEISTDPVFNTARYYANYGPVSDREVSWTLEHFWSERPPTGHGETF
jgi:putative phosphoribosyl transferase